MKHKHSSFTGRIPVFSGSPSIVTGGFNLDVQNQCFNVGDEIPAGTLAIEDEQTRLVQLIKTGKVSAIDADDSKIVSLVVKENYEPIFAVGDYIVKAGSAAANISSTPTITKIEKSAGKYVVTLSAAITGLAVGDTIEEVISDGAGTPKTKERGTATSVTISDTVVSEFETAIDVSADTMQYALYERRVLPIPASQKSENGKFLKANPNVKLSQSF